MEQLSDFIDNIYTVHLHNFAGNIQIFCILIAVLKEKILARWRRLKERTYLFSTFLK